MMGQSEEKTITFAYVVMNSEQTITYTKWMLYPLF
jgi:hypothetical protein